MGLLNSALACELTSHGGPLLPPATGKLGRGGKLALNEEKTGKGGQRKVLTLLEKTLLTIEFTCKIFSVHYCDWSLIFG